MSVIAFIIGKTIADSLWAMFIMLPVSAPAIMLIVAHHLFRRHNLTKLVYSEAHTFLEIKLPRELNKSPQAMELVLGAFYQTSQGNWYTKYFKGRHRRWFSLEVASMQGSLHFVIWVTDRHRNLIESSFYAQYPDIEIREVEDYTLEVDYLSNTEAWGFHGIENGFAKPACFPIKTYVDFGLDRDPKEEFKNDPMLNFLEVMGNIGKGEYLWTQMLIRAAMDQPGLKKQADEEVKKLVKKEKKVSGSDLFKTIMDKPTPGESLIAESIEKKMMKMMFDVIIRTMYVGKKENFRSPIKYSVFNPFRVYNNPQGNSFDNRVETDSKSPVHFEGGWYPKDWRLSKMARQMFDAYRKRSGFYPPYHRTPVQLNVEELATLYHFPGRVSETPTLGRIESKRGEPPVNLPV